MKSKKKAPAGQGRAPFNHNQDQYTKRELAEQLLRRFEGRIDRVAAGSTSGFAPESGPLTAERLAADHLSNERCYALYLMRADSTVSVSCVDFDSKPANPDPDIRTKVRKITTYLLKQGIKPLVEVSQSGVGFHVWMFLAAPQPAWFMRRLWQGVAKAAGVAVREIFPAQDFLSGKGLGNPIRYPLFGKSKFVDVADWSTIDPMSALKVVTPVNIASLTKIARSLEVAVDSPPTRASPSINLRDEGAYLSPRIQALLAQPDCLLAKRWNGDTNGLNDTSRSALVFSIACLLTRRFVPTAEIEAAIRQWCVNSQYEKGMRPDWIRRVIQNAFQSAWVQKTPTSERYRIDPLNAAKAKSFHKYRRDFGRFIHKREDGK